MTANKILHEWEDIQDDFRDCLLIGNGASIAVRGEFGYTYLFQEAISQGIINEDAEKVFQEFTEPESQPDFEHVLAMLATASRVNRVLSIQDEKTNITYENIRNGLIKAVTSIHPDHANVIDELEKAGNFASHFKSVVSLNYDLIFPWIRMLAKDNPPKIAFKDGFGAGGYFMDDWEKVKEPLRYRGENSVIMCYYPHGSLSFVTNEDNRVVKISADKAHEKNLLKTITNKWMEGYCVPLFVSEGTSPQKLNAIRRSAYLSEIYYRVLPNKVGSTLVIYGSSIQENDAHIFSALLTGRISDIAVSMYQPKDFESESDDIEKMLKKCAAGKSINIKFFNAESAGAWIY